MLLARDDEENIEDTMRGLKLQGDVVSDEKKRQLEVLVAEFGDIFRETPGLTKLTSHTSDTGEATPIRSQAYRVPMHWKEPFKKELDQLLEQGIIKPSRSPWASPTVAVKKSDGSLRICVDYRCLNALTVADPYRMPRVDDLMDEAGNAKFLSKIDLRKQFGNK